MFCCAARIACGLCWPCVAAHASCRVWSVCWQFVLLLSWLSSMLLLLSWLSSMLLLPVCFFDLGVRFSAVCPTEPFAVFCSGTAAYKTALLRSVRRHCALAPLTQPALAVHFNCRQPRHDVRDKLISYLFPLPSLSAAYPAPCALGSPALHSLRSLFRLVRSGLRASTHSCSAFPCPLGLVPATANAGWRAITGTNCRRAPSAS